MERPDPLLFPDAEASFDLIVSKGEDLGYNYMVLPPSAVWHGLLLQTIVAACFQFQTE